MSNRGVQRHGTVSTYRVQGCRCEECCKAYGLYKLRENEKKARRRRLGHGYADYPASNPCRCDKPMGNPCMKCGRER